MPVTIERLRLGIVALAALLLLAIAGSFLYGRWRFRHIAQDLPARLGVQIEQSTRGFVLSQSNAQGRNLFTLHAARAIEFKSGGRVSLHDVKIELYNRDGGPPDTIAGQDFEYDPRSEIVQSHGEAHIVLRASANTSSSGKSGETSQPIRLTTHELVFNRKTGVATCSGEVDFATSDASGQAIGAVFDSRLGHLVLASRVVLTASMHDRPATLHASRASYDRNKGEIDLSQPRYAAATPEGNNTGAAAAATIFLRPDNSAERLDASGDVRLVSAGGIKVQAPAMQVLLTEKNQPRQANFSGGVTFSNDQRGYLTRGIARQTEVSFDAQGRADRAVLDGAVNFQQDARAGKNELQRTLSANHLVLNLSMGAKNQTRLQSANAAGNAVFTSQSTIPGHPAQKTVLAGDVLNTMFSADNQPQQIDGTGHTRLRMIAASGNTDTSAGDTLRIEFEPRKPGATTIKKPAAETQTAPLTAASIRTAVQTGHVILEQTERPNSNGAARPRVSTATAERASYAAANDTLTLTGDPVFRQGQLEMAARRIEVERTTGNVTTSGAVTATMVSGNPETPGHSSAIDAGLFGGSQPVHIVAEHAFMSRQDQKAVFSGAARLWQGGDTIESPVIELSQKEQILIAYGPPPCTQCVVSSFVASTAGLGSRQKPAKTAPPSAIRILSQKLLYSDAERKATFLHHVELIGPSGRMTADQADVLFANSARRSSVAETSAQPGRQPNQPSSVEKIIATGNVRLWQPGRIATGGRLIYTTADGNFVLTGSETKPPEVTDSEHGTVRGQILTFASRDQAIMVSGAPGHTTTTTTRVQQK